MRELIYYWLLHGEHIRACENQQQDTPHIKNSFGFTHALRDSIIIYRPSG